MVAFVGMKKMGLTFLATAVASTIEAEAIQPFPWTDIANEPATKLREGFAGILKGLVKENEMVEHFVKLLNELELEDEKEQCHIVDDPANNAVVTEFLFWTNPLMKAIRGSEIVGLDDANDKVFVRNYVEASEEQRKVFVRKFFKGLQDTASENVNLNKMEPDALDKRCADMKTKYDDFKKAVTPEMKPEDLRKIATDKFGSSEERLTMKISTFMGFDMELWQMGLICVFVVLLVLFIWLLLARCGSKKSASSVDQNTEGCYSAAGEQEPLTGSYDNVENAWYADEQEKWANYGSTEYGDW
jgi:hypothetical protein